MPAIGVLIPLIIQGIQAAIAAAPQVASIVQKGKDLISSLFAAKAITKEQQDALHAQIDAIAVLVATGAIPPAWTVEKDPE